jgi:hypothetical protein
VEKTYGPEGLKVLEELVRDNIIRRNQHWYMTGHLGKMKYRKTASDVIRDALGSPDLNAKSAQQAIIDAATITNLNLTVDKTKLDPGIEGGQYNSEAAAAVLAQNDPQTFVHEFAHHLTSPLMDGQEPVEASDAATAELRAIAKVHEIPGELPTEGIAYMAEELAADPDATRQKYPEATAYFDKLLDINGQRDVFETFSRWYRGWNALTPSQRQAARVKTKAQMERYQGKRLPRIVRFLQSLFDSGRSLFATHKSLNPSELDDAYAAFNLASSSESSADEQFEHGYRSRGGRVYDGSSFGDVADALEQWSKDTGRPVAEGLAYLDAMAMIDRNPGFAVKYGLDNIQYGNWTRTRALEPGKYPFNTDAEIDAANEKLYDDWKAAKKAAKKAKQPIPPEPKNWHRLNQAENESPKDIADAVAIIKENPEGSVLRTIADTHLKSANDNMVRFRLDHGLATAAKAASQFGVSYYVPRRTELLNPEEVKAEGSAGHDILHSLDALFEKNRMLFKAAAKQEVVRRLFRSVSEEAARRAMPYPQKGDMLPLSGLVLFNPANRVEKGYRKEVDDESTSDLDENVYITLDARTAETFIRNGQLPEVVPEVDENGNVQTDNEALAQAIAKYVGKTYTAKVPDPDIRKSLKLAGAPFAHGAPAIFRIPATIVRTLATTLNPEYWMRGFSRDMVSSVVQSSNRKNYIRSIGLGAKAAWTASGGATHAETADETDSALMGMGIAASTLSNQEPSLRPAMTRLDINKALSMVGLHNKALRFLSKVTRVSDTLELTNRFAEARRVIMGELAAANVEKLSDLTEDQAQIALQKGFRAAQEVGVNFRRRGTNPLIGFMAGSIPFFNPALQGSLAAVRALTGGKLHVSDSATPGARLSRAALAWTALTVPALVQLMALMGGSDEDREKFNEIPDHERMRYYHIRTDSGWARFPKPQGLFAGVLASIENTFNNDPRTWADIGEDTFGDIAPQAYIPTAFQLLGELHTGTRWGSTTNLGVGATERFRGVETAESRSAPGLASALADLGGWSPMQVEQLIRGYTGGLGWLSLDAPQAIMAAAGADPRADYTPANYPLARVFAMKDPTWNQVSITRMYDAFNELSNKSKTYEFELRKLKERRQTAGEFKEFRQEHKDVVLGKVMSNAMRGIQESYTAARIKYERINRDPNMSVVDRRRAMDDVMDSMTDKARKILDKIKGVHAKREVEFEPDRTP